MDYYLLQFQFKTAGASLDLLTEKATSEAISISFETWLRTQALQNRTRTFYALLGRTPGPELRKVTIDFSEILYLAAKPEPIVYLTDTAMPSIPATNPLGKITKPKPRSAA